MINTMTLSMKLLSRACSTRYPMPELYQPSLIGVKISSQDIVDLATNKIRFLRRPNYISKRLCEKFFQHYQIQDYENVLAIGKAAKLRVALFECNETTAEEKRAHYYEQAARSMGAIRQALDSSFVSFKQATPQDGMQMEAWI